NANTVGLFYENHNFPLAIAHGVRATASELNMPLLYDVVVPRHQGQLGVPGSSYETDTNLDSTELSSLEDLLNTIIAHDADAVAGGTYYDLCRNLMVKFKERDYVPKAIGMTTCMSEELIHDVGDSVRYVMGASGWD